eukprot:403354521
MSKQQQAVFHTLNLREPINKQQKQQELKQNARQRQKTYLKDLLVQNFMKKYSQKLTSNNKSAAQTSIIITNIIGNQIENFLDKEQLTQKNLKQFEKDLEGILERDPRINSLLDPVYQDSKNNRLGSDQQQLQVLQSRKNSQTLDGYLASIGNNKQNNVNVSQQNLTLPKILSATPTREDPKTSLNYQKNRLNALVKNQSNKFGSLIEPKSQGTSPYGLNPMKQSQSNMSTIVIGGNPFTDKPYNNLGGSIAQANKSQFGGNNILNSSRVQNNQTMQNNGFQHQNSNVRNSYSQFPITRKNNIGGERGETSKSFADLRLASGKIGMRDIEVDSIPSDLSGDEWNEIVKFEKEKFEEEKQKQKEDFLYKRKMIKETLDKQLKDRNQRIKQEQEEKKKFDTILLQTAKQQIDEETKKNMALKNKIYEQKNMRDIQLQQAQQKKSIDFMNQRENEIEIVSKLRSEIETEKKQKQEKKMKEREQAWKVINENQEYKQKQIQDKEKERDRDNKMLEEYNKLLEQQEKKRADEWNQRENRIQSLMNKMADTVVKRSNQAEKEVENRVMRYQLDKEERDRLADQKKKEQMRRKHQEIKEKLDQQMNEKKKQKEHESFVNDDYMKKWIDITEKDANERKQKEMEHKQKQREVQDFLLKQMGTEIHQDGVPSVVSHTKRKPNGKNSVPMTAEELRLNKQLLKEISKKKKEKMGMNGSQAYGNGMSELALSEYHQ